jgi:hypothetical protein
MSYNGSGVFNINTSGQPVVTGTVISSTAFNALTADLATGLTTALTKDGQTTPTANIPMGGFKITGIAAATTLGDALSYGRAATVTSISASSVTDSGLTSGRVTYASTGGLLTDSANLTFSGSALAVTGTLSATDAQIGYTGVNVPNGSNNQGLYIPTYNIGLAGAYSSINWPTTSASPSTSAWWIFGRAGSDNVTQLKIRRNTGVDVSAYIVNASGTDAAKIVDNHQWYTSGSQAMTLNASGNLGIGVTSPACILDISGSTGGQIKFPATQNASSDANTLDDYEEGTFSFTANPDTGGVTLQNATGYYTKIGRLVNIRAYVDVASVSSPSGNIYFTAPFVGRRATAVGSIDANGTFNSFTGLTLVVKIQATQSFFYLQTFNSSVGGIGAAASYLKAGSAFNVNITYETD